MSEAQVFALPDVGEGLTEADVLTWHVQVGDSVEVNAPLVDVETAKSVVELPSPYAGVVVALHAGEGETLPVGAPLISIGTAVATAPEAAPVVTAPVPEDVESPLVLVGTGPKEAGGRRLHVRRLAGPDDERPRRPVPVAEVDSAASSGDTHLPVKGVRKATAEAMVRSAFTAPHATLWTSVDVSASMGLVARLRSDRSWAGVRVTPLLIVARTVALAVREFPEINASWDEMRQEIVLKRTLNLGVAASTPRGLMVPNIKDVDALSMRELAGALDDLVTRARAGTLTPADMSGGTFTVTNVGSFGVEGATPIINPPEAAILAVGVSQPRPWVVAERVEIRDVMTLSISIDHRLVDGELGASVLHHVADLLHDPARALLQRERR